MVIPFRPCTNGFRPPDERKMYLHKTPRAVLRCSKALERHRSLHNQERLAKTKLDGITSRISSDEMASKLRYPCLVQYPCGEQQRHSTFRSSTDRPSAGWESEKQDGVHLREYPVLARRATLTIWICARPEDATRKLRLFLWGQFPEPRGLLGIIRMGWYAGIRRDGHPRPEIGVPSLGAISRFPLGIPAFRESSGLSARNP